MPPSRQYYWYDTEDGEDILKKLNFASKFAVMGAFPFVVYDQILNRQKSMRGYGFRFLVYNVPALGMAGMFTITTQLLCKHVPQVDPKAHYAIGGVAAGAVIGAATRSVFNGSLAGLYLAAAAFIARDIHDCATFNVWGEYSGLGTLKNDDEFLNTDWRGAPPITLPPPAARPARGGSELFIN